MKKLTPTKSIKEHCRVFCMNGNAALIRDCAKISDCALAKKMPALKKIKSYCRDCAPDFKPHECDGIILNTDETKKYGKCPLWIYRFGRNPNLKGKGNVKNLIPFKKAREKMHV